MKNYTIILLTLLLVFSGCSDSWLEEEAPHLITTETLYTTWEGFEYGLNGLYGLTRQEREGSEGTTLPYTSNPNSWRADLMMNGTDDMCTNTPDRFSLVTAYWGERHNPSNFQITSNFVWHYTVINAANTIINKAEDEDINWTGGSNTPEENKNRVIGEAKALRALAYRHLVYGWGDVPINLDESKGSMIRTDWERRPVSEVKRQIITDLQFAEKYVATEPPVPGKISKGAVQHYLAETYLSIGKPDSALIWANKVIDNPAYKLVTSRYGVKAKEPGVAFMDMFYDENTNRADGNTEALWVWQWAYGPSGSGQYISRRWHISSYNLIIVNGVNPLKLTYERGGRGVSRIGLTKWLIDSYEPQDDRGTNFAIRKYFILKDAAGNAPVAADVLPPGYKYGDTIWMHWDKPITLESNDRKDWPYSRKYEGTRVENASSGNQPNDMVYLRLADTYLLKAEAHHLLNQNDQAANTINVIRRRSNASEISAPDITMDFILDERARELVFEEHRRYTLARTGKLYERVKLYDKIGGVNFSERDTLYPIPQSVIDANLTATMTQNPGF